MLYPLPAGDAFHGWPYAPADGDEETSGTGIVYWSEFDPRVCPEGDGDRVSTLLLLPGRSAAGVLFTGRGSEGRPRGGGRSAGGAALPFPRLSAGYCRRGLQ